MILFFKKFNTASVVGLLFFFFSSRRRHTILQGDWSSDVCSSDLLVATQSGKRISPELRSSTLCRRTGRNLFHHLRGLSHSRAQAVHQLILGPDIDRKSVV